MRVIWLILIIIVVAECPCICDLAGKSNLCLKKTIALLHMFKPKHFNLGHTA